MEQLKVDTPELVELELQLAGIGSRFLAIAVDTVLQLSLLVSAVLGLSVVQAPAFLRGSVVGLAGPALLILFAFSVYWGYFALFEYAWAGQTPGKRLAGIRVIKDSGRPITAIEAITRNVLRAVDFLPAMYAVGILCMMLNRHSRRLGDFVAGTVVVHDRRTEAMRPDVNPSARAQTGGAAVARVTPEELQLIEAYLHRRTELDEAVRADMAERIVRRITAKTGLGPLPDQATDEFLESVARQIRDAARWR